MALFFVPHEGQSQIKDVPSTCSRKPLERIEGSISDIACLGTAKTLVTTAAPEGEGLSATPDAQALSPTEAKLRRRAEGSICRISAGQKGVAYIRVSVAKNLTRKIS